MSGIDADIQAAYSSPAPVDASGAPVDDDVKSAFSNDRSGDPSPWAHIQQAFGIAKRHPFTFGLGLMENAAQGVASGAGSLAEAVTGADPGSISSNWAAANAPATAAGKEYAAGTAAESANMGRNYDSAFGTGPLASTIKERVPQALGAVGTITSLAGLPAAYRGASVPALGSSVDSPQSLGAAAATPNLANVSPELRAAAQDVVSSGGKVNPAVFERHAEAESLPVPIRLTKGQATQDPVLISQEMNTRGQNNGALAEHFQGQNKGLTDNLQAMRDEVGPDVFTTNQTEHGEALIGYYKAKNARAEADISSKYQALRDANGGQFPVDAKALLNNASAELHKNLLFEHAPTAEMRQLGNMAENGMTFEQYEAMRTNLARVMRSSSDGNEVAAAGVIRNAMEQLPLTGDAAKLKPLADAARGAARAQFQALREDPAYGAAVNGKVSPDRFVSRFLIGGDKGNVALMRQNIPEAQQTMGVAALDHLRQAAGIDEQFRGNFSQAGYNKHFQALGPKLSQFFNPQQTETLSTLGNVARNTMAQPRGAFVSNSNTAPALLAEKGGQILSGIADAKTGGLWSAVGKPILKGRAAKAFAEEHLKPGAGLDYVPQQ